MRQSAAFFGVAFVVSYIIFLQPATLSGQRNRIAGPVSGSRRVLLKGHLHPKAIAGADQGRVDASLKIPYVTLVLQASASQQAELEQLLAQQQDPSSPNYHRWLTPEEYGTRFGASQDDVNKIVSWLQQEGLVIANVARARNAISFSGTAGQVGHAFGTEIHHYLAGGKLHFANATEPSIPAAFQGVVSAIHGLNDFRMHAPRRRLGVKPNYTSSGGNHDLAPDDIATIYNIKPLYGAGIDGSGQKVAVAGQSQLTLSDIQRYRSYFNLPANDPQTVLVPNSRDPGVVSGDVDEANLDVELAGAVARNATVVFVYATDVMNAVQYAIDQNVAPVLAISYGSCELETTNADAMNMQSWAKQANAQGMTWFAASGDAGGADCYGSGSRRSSTGASVDLPAGIPEVTGVGGTEFNEGSGNYWNSGNDANRASALAYIPEMVWNDSVADRTPSASGGGASAMFAKPAWQTGAGVPNDGARDVPDVSLAASADHDGFFIYTGGQLQVFGGTSAGSPTFAGIAALLNHYLIANGIQAGAGLGNMNPRLYSLAQTAPGAFHDITTGDNMVNPCSARSFNCNAGSVGFNAGPGYDQATGLGSVDVSNLVTGWQNTGNAITRGGTTVAVSSSATDITFSGAATLTATVTSSNGGTPTGTVTFFVGGASIGTAALAGSGGTASATLTVNGGQLSAGNNTITAQYSGDAAYNAAAASVAITVSAGTGGTPSIAGLANGASFQRAYAPGMILSVFGSQLAPTNQSAPGVPLPTQLAGVSATINGVAAPLYYVSPGQLNLQIPYGISPYRTAVLSVNNNGHTTSSSFSVAPAAPGIFTDANGAPVPGSGTARGQVATLFITGDGAVSPSIPTGTAPSPGTSLDRLPSPVQSVFVRVAGLRAPIQFVGIPVGLVGVTQINFQVPSQAPLGKQAVVVTVGGVSSAPANLNITN